MEMCAAIVAMESQFDLSPVASIQAREQCIALPHNGVSDPGCEASFSCVGSHKTRARTHDLLG